MSERAKEITLGGLELDQETYDAFTDALTKAKVRDIFVLPESKEDRFYCIVSLLQKFFDGSNMGKDLAIDQELAVELKVITGTLVYLLNSTSFRDGEYHAFDKFEVNKKLNRHK